jgi:L-ascorbate metabolism protein UlaG (beta-lactamase superfamily)
MRILSTALFLSLSLLIAAAHAAGNTELTWYGHSAFKLKTPNGKILLIDPWIANPANKNGKEDLAKLDKANLILVTHGHADHVGNSVEIAKKTGARLVSTFDLGKGMVTYGGFPKEQAGFDTQGNAGGELNLLDGEVKIAFIPAVHSSAVTDEDGKNIHDGGAPGGFLISVKNGPTIYHTGDTDVFADMALIPHFHKVDVMLACIGDHFTMGPERAAEAVKLVQPTIVIPMHFGTFPVLTGTPEAFGAALKKQHLKTQLRVMHIGQTLKL